MSTDDRNTDAEETSEWTGRPGARYSPRGPGQLPPPPPTVPPQGASGWVPPTAPGLPVNAYGQPATPSSATGSAPKKIMTAFVAVISVAAVGAGLAYFAPLKQKILGTQSSSTSSSVATSRPDSPTPAAPSTPSNTPTATSPPRGGGLIDPANLSHYLASPDELSNRFDGAVMQPQGLTKEPFNGIDVDPYSCSGAVVPGIDAAYSGADFTGFVGQVINDAANQHKAVQALASFATAAAAQDFVSRQITDWRGCTSKELTITINDKEDHVTTGVVADNDNGRTYSLLMFQPHQASGHQCERAMTARSNVVVDVRACSPSVGSLGYTIARDIGQKITGQR